MSKTSKIQSLLVNHLLKHGQIQLKLPDGVVLEIGVTQEGDNGAFEIKDDYCWVIATRENRSACLDAYNLGLRIENEEGVIVMDDEFTGTGGSAVRRLDVI